MSEHPAIRCTKCKTIKARHEFGPIRNRTGKPHSWCKPCMAVAKRQRYRDNPEREKDAVYRSRIKKVVELTERTDAIRALTPCADCRLCFDPIAMDFHHRDPATKLAPVSRMVNRALAWSVIQAEIAKCDVLCSNCHRIRTKPLWLKRRSEKWNRLREEFRS